MSSRACPGNGVSSLSRLRSAGCRETHFACRKRRCTAAASTRSGTVSTPRPRGTVRANDRTRSSPHSRVPAPKSPRPPSDRVLIRRPRPIVVDIGLSPLPRKLIQQPNITVDVSELFNQRRRAVRPVREKTPPVDLAQLRDEVLRLSYLVYFEAAFSSVRAWSIWPYA
jgi:hypothetical protein